MNLTDELARLVHFYETLSPQSLSAQLAGIYAIDARFKDPFNEVRGIEAIEAIFVHMFEQVFEPRFVVTTRVLQGVDAMLVWDFTYRTESNPELQSIRGATHVRFDEAGAVVMHRDYWDAAEELYEKLPVLGSLMRWLKRKVNGA